MTETVLQIVIFAVPVIAAIVLHEVAHGFVAYRLGDPTASEAGRLTLNPVAHVDPVGTVILPALLVITNAPFLFGWAKPVPIDYRRLRHPRRDMIWVAAAGPGTNLALAVLGALAYHTIAKIGGAEPGVGSILLMAVAQSFVLMNVCLGVFNLVPVPPLDGGRVMTGLLPLEWARRYAQLEPWGFLIVIAGIVTGLIGLFVGPPIRILLAVLL